MLAHSVFFSLHDNSPAAIQKLVDACKKYLPDHPGVLHFAAGTLNPDLTVRSTISTSTWPSTSSSTPRPLTTPTRWPTITCNSSTRASPTGGWSGSSMRTWSRSEGGTEAEVISRMPYSFPPDLNALVWKNASPRESTPPRITCSGLAPHSCEEEEDIAAVREAVGEWLAGDPGVPVDRAVIRSRINPARFHEVPGRLASARFGGHWRVPMNGSLEMHPSRRHSGLIDSKMPYSRWRVSRNDSLLQESGTLGASLSTWESVKNTGFLRKTVAENYGRRSQIAKNLGKSAILAC